MTDREKLTNIVCNAMQNGCVGHCNYPPCYPVLLVVDALIANGVVVRPWIPLTEEKPGRDERVLVFFEGMRGTPAETQIMCGWCIDGSATHWQHCPEPPKGVNHA